MVGYEVEKITNEYNNLVRGVDKSALDNNEGRAYGGIVRAEKGELVENIAKQMVKLAWKNLNQNPDRLKLIGKQIRIPINEEYIDNIKNKEIKDYIIRNIKKYYYPYKPDVLVEIDGKLVMEIECKAYTENAMFKRILVDATLLKTLYPDMKFILLQLESQLGGDFSELNDITYGSPSTHTLLSYFNVDLTIITLLKGERKVDRPIHKYFKELKEDNIIKAIKILEDKLNFFK